MNRFEGGENLLVSQIFTSYSLDGIFWNTLTNSLHLSRSHATIIKNRIILFPSGWSRDLFFAPSLGGARRRNCVLRVISIDWISIISFFVPMHVVRGMWLARLAQSISLSAHVFSLYFMGDLKIESPMPWKFEVHSKLYPSLVLLKLCVHVCMCSCVR